ncbi:MAG: prolipoprotein diacylglyceryl transferase [Acholeplasmatales bacterium]
MKKNQRENKFIEHFINFKTPYLMGLSFVVWFLLLLIFATVGQMPPYKTTAIEIGNFRVAWYAIFIMTGILFGVVLAVYEAKFIDINKTYLLDGALYAIILSILGARLYYVIFDPNKATNYRNIGDVFNIAGGGMAIHGAIITAIIFVIIYSKVKKMNVFALSDLLAPGFLIGQIIGRWGNFINQEAHGGPMKEGTYNVLKNIIPSFIMENMNIGGVYYHPTFLYEGLWNLLGLIIILIVRRKRLLKVGDLLGYYLIWYGLGRGLLIEPFRTDPLYIGPLRVNILFSIVLFAAGGISYLIVKNVLKRDLPYYLDLVNENKAKLENEKS